MKNFSKIFLLFCVVAVLCCCEHKVPGGGETPDSNVEDIHIPSDGYIFFNVEPLTRGALIERGPFAHNFNVLGYNYQGRWEAASTTASQTTPMTNGTDIFMGVFYSSNITDKKGVQLVKYDENTGTHSYTYEGVDKSDVGNFKEWDGSLRYAFFAWYPTDLVVNDGKVGTLGSPYIKYTLDGKSRAEMVDVMTGCKIDISKFKGSTVIFTMGHRLAALDLKANSIITMKSLKEAWPDINFEAEDISDNATITVENITNLSLSLDTIKANVTIPLNTEDATEKMVADGVLSPTYNDFDCAGMSIPYYSKADDMKSLMGDNKLILIPQEEDIDASVVISYDVVCRDGENSYTIHYDRGSLDTKSLSAIIRGLEESHSHYLELTFTASGVFLQARKELTWTDVDVEYEFN